jgi:hypothetical protein
MMLIFSPAAETTCWITLIYQYHPNLSELTFETDTFDGTVKSGKGVLMNDFLCVYIAGCGDGDADRQGEEPEEGLLFHHV